jgi:MFS family permease
MTTASAIAAPFVRDRFTWLAYLLLGYYAYMQSAIGPLMNFLTDELSLNYTVRGLHLSGYALGMLLAGMFGDRVAHWLGRRRVFWGGGLGMVIGALILIVGQHPLITVIACFTMGFLGSFLLVMIQATLTDHHGERRAVALTESNVVAIICTALAPILVGWFEQVDVGWRMTLIIGMVMWGVLVAFGIRLPLPQRTTPVQERNGEAKLPRVFWVYWLVVFFCVGVEWSMIFWSGDFLERVIGLSTEQSTTLMSVFLIAMVVGRALGSRLAGRAESGRLLLISICLVIFGFPIFWLSPMLELNIIGLFIAGLGVANLYPFTLAVTTGLVPAASNTASARTSMASGAAILLAPQVLGSAADVIGIQSAIGITGILAIAALVTALAATYMTTKRPNKPAM